jgi:hypothetical protein
MALWLASLLTVSGLPMKTWMGGAIPDTDRSLVPASPNSE